MRIYKCVYIYLCVRERAREKERESERERAKTKIMSEREYKGENMYIYFGALL